MTASSEVWLFELTPTFGRTLAVDTIPAEILGDSVAVFLVRRAAARPRRCASSRTESRSRRQGLAWNPTARCMPRPAPIECTKNAQGGVSEPSAEAMTLPAEGDTVAIGWNDTDAHM
jgi:hypothetical protein